MAPINCGQLVSEIKSGGIKGCFGIDQIQWSGSAGAIWEVWKCEPCCGSPCNPKDAVYCLFCWTFCSLCSTSKLYASSLGQGCALVPHILCTWMCFPLIAPCLRYNLRKKSGTSGTICGDLVCMYFCGCCSWFQQLRSVNSGAWDIWPLQVPGIVASPMKLMV